MKNEILLVCKKISKNFGSTCALKEADLEIPCGDIRGLIGENGYGKSTLSSIISGVQMADSGEMWIKGEVHHPRSMLEAQKHKISMIVQETGTIPGITVAANIFIGQEKMFSSRGILRIRKMMDAARRALENIGVTDIAPDCPIDALNFENRKIVEIARAMAGDPDLLIVDETTTALSHRGRQILYNIMEKMADDGKSVLFISHDMEELMQVCRSITVLRDGVMVKNLCQEEMEIERIKTLMVGRELSGNYYRADYDSSHKGKVVLSGRHVTCGDILENFDFDLHGGEILGIGGLTDSGMHDVGRAAFGASKLLTGEIRAGNKLIKNASDAIAAKIGYVPKNRDTESVILDDSILNNIVLPALKILSNKSYISPVKESDLAKEGVDALSIKCREATQDVRDLSGGNRQKVAVAKWIMNGTEIFIMDCPTRGIDISVKAYLYQLIYRLKTEGKSIMMISEEMTELIGMCDRILIVKDGRLSHEFERSETLSENDIIQYMI